MSVKIAVAGKGGVGKTTLSAALARSLARAGESVLAVDADPNNCLGRALGFPAQALSAITPLSEMRELLAERAGRGEGGSFFSLSPRVEDLLARYQLAHDGISLLVMGTVDEPGAGCVCPESAVLKALLRHLVSLDMSLVMDMEAGLEHLGRGTAQRVGALLIVTEPTAVSARTAVRIARLAQGLGLRLPGVVVNKASSPGVAEEIRPLPRAPNQTWHLALQSAALGAQAQPGSVLLDSLEGLEVIGTLPLDPAVWAAEAVPGSGPFVEAVEKLRAHLAQWMAS